MNAPVTAARLLPTPITSDPYSTHVVKNQARAAAGFNAFDGDVVLTAAIQRLANRHLPELKTHDRYGNRIDWVDFHPSWHELMGLAWKHEVHSLAWNAPGLQPHFARAVGAALGDLDRDDIGAQVARAAAGVADQPARADHGAAAHAV